MNHFRVSIIGLAALGLLSGLLWGQEDVPDSPPLFIRATIYPTLSLARYDYNNDVNKVEMRVYLNVRDGQRDGPVIRDAEVSVNGGKIPFNKEERDYRQRLDIDNMEWNRDILIEVRIPDGRSWSGSHTFPGWLLLKDPQPSIITDKTDLAVNWTFTGHPFGVTVHVFDFKQGQRILRQSDVGPGGIVVPGDSLPPNTILRIWITPHWFYKQYIRGEGIARGSEINVIPWSQTFLRTRFSPGGAEDR